MFERKPYLCAILACGVSVAAHLLTPASLDVPLAFLLYSPAVAVAAWVGGFGPGAFATLFSLVVLSLAVEPGREFATPLAFIIFAATGLAISAAAEAGRRQQLRDRYLRTEAERVCRSADRLEQLASSLSKATTMTEVARTAVIEATHSFHAAAGTIALITEDGRSAEAMHAVGFDEELKIEALRFPLDAHTPVSDSIQRGAIITLPSRELREDKYRHQPAPDWLAAFEAVAIVPLPGRGRPMGALTLALADRRDWTTDDRELLLQEGRRIGQALDRARAYELAERARLDSEELRGRADQELAERQRIEDALRDSEARYRALAARTSRLHALTAALSEAVTVDAVARAVVRQGRIVVGAQSGSVTRLIDDGTRFATVYADDESLPLPEGSEVFAADAGLYSTDVVTTRKPVFIGSFTEWQRRYWRSAANAADGGYASAAALPLIADGEVRGVLSFHFTAPLNFDEEYKLLLMSVAQHCSQALDRARLYEGEQHARTEAEAANRSKDEFLSTVSHELRTPLNAIMGWATMLRTGSVEPDKKDRAMQAICDNAARQARLVDELLDVSRIIAGRVSLDVRDVDLRETLRGAVEAMMPQAEAKGLQIRLSSQLPVIVRGDDRRLEQVFLNLISNAVKFTPAGGMIEVAVAVADSSVSVRITDTGIGMDPAFIPHAFDRFRQADAQTTRTYGGLGLGLSIANHLVGAHGGTIQMHSEGAGTGTTSMVTLPLAAIGGQAGRHVPQRQQPDNAPGAFPNLNGVRVLVVDDEADALEMMATALERCGGTVEAAPSAAAALEILKTRRVDVLLSDIGMPDEDGYELIRRVRAWPAPDTAHIPAAAVTAYARDDQRQLALSAGFQMHLAKPLDPRGLAEAVATLVRNGTRTAASHR